MRRITIYGTPNCQPCKLTLKRFMEAANVEFDYKLADDAMREKLYADGWRSFPVVLGTLAGDWCGFHPAKIAEACGK